MGEGSQQLTDSLERRDQTAAECPHFPFTLTCESVTSSGSGESMLQTRTVMSNPPDTTRLLGRRERQETELSWPLHECTGAMG